MSKRRKFTPEFKSQVVLQLLCGEKSMAELCREHLLTSQVMGNWKQQLLAAALQAFEQGGGTSAEQERSTRDANWIGWSATWSVRWRAGRWMGASRQVGCNRLRCGW